MNLHDLALKSAASIAPAMTVYRDPSPFPLPKKNRATKDSPAFILTSRSYATFDDVHLEIGLTQSYAASVILVFDHEHDGEFVFMFLKNRYAEGFDGSEFFDALRQKVGGRLAYRPPSNEYPQGSLVTDVVAYIDIRSNFP